MSFWLLRIGFGFFLRQESHHCQPAGTLSLLVHLIVESQTCFSLILGILGSNSNAHVESGEVALTLLTNPTAKGDARGDVFQHVHLHSLV